MTKEEENEAIRDHHMPIELKKLAARVTELTAERDSLKETLRDRFAMAALTGFCMGRSDLIINFAQDSFNVADAMLEVRKK